MRLWIYHNEGIVRISVTEDRPVELHTGGQTDEGYCYSRERYWLEDSVLHRATHVSTRDCDGRYEGGRHDYWQPEMGTVPCIEVDSQSRCVELPERRPNWTDINLLTWQRDYTAEAAGY